MQSEISQSTRNRQKNATAVMLKGSVFTLPILQIHVTSIAEIESELTLRLSKALKFFENAPIVIDLGMIRQETENFDFRELMKLLSLQHLIPVGVKNGSSQQNILALGAGLALLKDDLTQQNIEEKTQLDEADQCDDSVGDDVSEPMVVPVAPQQTKAKFVTQPVRSGQQIYAKGCDLIITAPVNHGAEIIADGNIHVYSSMRGRALAGVRGDVEASIFCQSMEAELVAIAGNFRVFEDAVPAEIKSKSVRIHLDDEQLIISQL